jgi:hypothetical protein
MICVIFLVFFDHESNLDMDIEWMLWHHQKLSSVWATIKEIKDYTQKYAIVLVMSRLRIAPPSMERQAP